ncbi:kunitz-type serine protease inhibitor textilinin-3 [Episyrphus balteatus]|uniref:kunitz-type serine protease inhibitor textilinin-3 n=1 Tax=Episyrphus balteatus TaxID=286459 RepID=UPI00248623D5|nr:kunitz-type serine protease inhibitor textilinin-3 [Episyrphus balteatus]
MNSKQYLTVSIALCTVILAITEFTQAKPLDLYDEMSDLFEEMDLDDIAPRTSARHQPENFCKMPARKGVCRALIPRWSYDPVAKECREFKFGGCDGNDNNFSSYKLCMQTCGGY